MRLDPHPRYVAQALAMALCLSFAAHAQQAGGKSGKAGKAQVVAKSASEPAAPGSQPSRLLTRCPDTRTAARDSPGGPPAQAGPVAWLRNLDGNALVSVDSGLVSGSEGSLMNEYTRVITTGDASLVVSYCDGCDVPLEPNQRLEIRLNRPCAERILDVKAVLIDAAVIGTASAPFASAALAGSLPTGAGLLSGLGGSIAIVRGREDQVVSPN